MITELCKILEVEVSEVLGRSRTSKVAFARKIYFWLMHRSGYNYTEIGRLSDRNHSTILYAVNTVNEYLETGDRETTEIVEKVKHLRCTKTEKPQPAEEQIIIAVDFDGTLHDGEYPAIGKPIDGAMEYMQKLKEDGFCIILWTCRYDGELLKALLWLVEQNIPFSYVNKQCPENLAKYEVDTRKVFAHVYVDDRQVGGLRPWDETYEWAKKVQDENKKKALASGESSWEKRAQALAGE